MEAIKDRPLTSVAIALAVGASSASGVHYSNSWQESKEPDCKPQIEQAVKDERQDCRLDQLEKD